MTVQITSELELQTANRQRDRLVELWPPTVAATIDMPFSRMPTMAVQPSLMPECMMLLVDRWRPGADRAAAWVSSKVCPHVTAQVTDYRAARSGL